MTRSTYIHHPLMLGFEQLERKLERNAKSGSDGYPPYNIEDLGDGKLRISLAVAGFGEDDLAIKVEGNQLVIQGKREDIKERVFLYKGIASRQFQRTFVLAEGLEVESADLENGLLHIDIFRPQPQTSVRNVKIASRKGNGESISQTPKPKKLSSRKAPPDHET